MAHIKKKTIWKFSRKGTVFSTKVLEQMDCCCSVTLPSPILRPRGLYSTPGFPVLLYLLEFAQTHIHWAGDAIQPSHPLLPSSHAFNLSQHQGLFQWVSSSHRVTKVQLDIHMQKKRKPNSKTHILSWRLNEKYLWSYFTEHLSIH